jgi:uncharacterized protein DUF6600
MKRLIIITAIFILFANTNTDAKQYKYRYSGISFNYFYSALQPHGEWIEIDYDVYVWRPYRVGRNWQPYSEGRWAWTNDGWYWDSYEPFGWATYHYGRWYFDDYFGWVWMPGYDWAPAWVEWRYSDDYIGWAPLSPYAAFDIHRGIHFSISWRTGYNHWHFVSFKHFGSHNINHHFVHKNYKHKIYNRTKYRTNYYANNGRIVNGGIDRNFIERKSGTRFLKRDITETTRIDDFSKSRNSNSDKIVSYRPSTSEIQKYRDVKRENIKVEIGRSTIKRDKISFESRSDDRNIIKQTEPREMKASRETTIKRKSSEQIKDRTVIEKSNSERNNSPKSYKRKTSEKKEIKQSTRKEVEQRVPEKRNSTYKKADENKVKSSVSKRSNKNKREAANNRTKRESTNKSNNNEKSRKTR